MFIVGSGFLGISIQLCSLQNFRTKLPKPPEHPLDIPRYVMNPHAMVPYLEVYVRASPLSLAQQLQMIS